MRLFILEVTDMAKRIALYTQKHLHIAVCMIILCTAYFVR
jgi:hypothetical protein